MMMVALVAASESNKNKDSGRATHLSVLGKAAGARIVPPDEAAGKAVDDLRSVVPLLRLLLLPQRSAR